MEFTIEQLPSLQFRTAKVSPVDLLAISTQIGFEKFDQTKVAIAFALENCEVLIGEIWYKVKEKGREVYWPMDIENNINALLAITLFFLENVVYPAFQNSNELNSKTL